MGLTIMILGLVLFLGAHTLTTRREARAALIGAMGEGGYKIAYSLVSVAGIALIAYGFSRYRAESWIDVWYPPTAFKHITVALMLPAVILVVAAYLRGRIYTAVKHPMLTGVKLWAAAHLLANGDLGSIILFGSVLAWAVYDRISLKSRSDAGGAADSGGRGGKRRARRGDRGHRLCGARLCFPPGGDRRPGDWGLTLRHPRRPLTL